MAIRGKNPNANLQQLADSIVRARLPYDKDMLLNLAFYLGEQYAEWKDDINTIRSIPRTAEQRNLNTPRPVVNKIMHFVNQSHSQALQTKPTVDVLPATDDVSDIQVSGVAKQYLMWLASPAVENFDHKLSEAAMWALVCGPGYIKWAFDAKLGRPKISVPSPLDIYPDPYVTNFYDSRYLLHRRFMDPEQVYNIYGVEVPADSTEVVDPVRSELMRSLGQSTAVSGVVVHELWYKKCRRYPDGLYAVWAANKRLVEPGRYPYKHGRLPYTQLGVIPRPGSMFSHSAVKYLRPAQMELNKYHAQRIQIREGFANPKWFIDSSLHQSLNSLPDDSVMQVLIGDSRNGQVKPEILQPTGMADNNEGVWIADEMMNIVGQHEVSQGQVPGRVESSKAIALLRESDNTRLAELGRTIDNSISEGFWQTLMLAQQYVPTQQIVVTYGMDGMPESQKLKTEDFKEGMHIRVTTGTGLGNTRAARQEQLLLLWQNQIIQDPQLMAELMELPIPTFIRATAYDIKLARSENVTMSNGDAVVPNSWDDHATHIKEHNAFRKTHEFLILGDEEKQKFEFHVQKHKELQVAMLLEQIQNQQLQMQAAGLGQPMTPSTAAGPQGEGQPQEQGADQIQVAGDLANA